MNRVKPLADSAESVRVSVPPDEEESEYLKIQNLASKYFGQLKLNVKRARMYLRVHRRAMLYRELCIYIVFICIFFGLTLVILRADQSFEHASYFGGSGALLWIVQLGSDQTAFNAMNTRADFYDYVRNIVVPLLNPAERAGRSLLEFDEPVGLVQLRQIRVRGTPCTRFYQAYECYTQFLGHNEETRPFVGKSSGTTYAWRDDGSKVEASFSFLRDYIFTSTYGSGGYVFYLPENATDATAAMDVLEADGWIDASTRAVVLSMALYNAHTDMYTAVELLAEFPPSGFPITSPRINRLKLQLWDEGALRFFTILFVMFIVYYVANEASELVAQGVLGYFTQPWNLMEVVALVCFVVTIVFYCLLVKESQAVRHKLQVNPQNTYVDLNTARRLVELISEVTGIAILVSAFRVFKFLRLNAKLSVLWSTLSLASKDLAAFVFIFIILFAGYAFMGHVIFGYQMEDFHNFTSSFSALFKFIGGDFDYDSMNDASPVAGVIFFFTFIILVCLILVNIFIAIIGKYYAEACDQAEQEMADIKASVGVEDSSVITKLSTMQLYIVAPTANHTLLQPGDMVKIWLSLTAHPKHKPNKDASSSKRVEGGPSRGGPRPPSGELQTRLKMTCTVAGRPIFVRFLPEVLNVGDVVYLVSRLHKDTQPCQLVLHKAGASSSGQYMKLRVVRPGILHTGVEVRISRWAACKYALSKYVLMTWTRFRKATLYFQEFGLAIPRPILTQEEIEQLFEIIQEENVKSHEQDTGVPGQRHTSDSFLADYSLDTLLRQISALSVTTDRRHVKIDDGRLGDLVQRAMKLDSLISQLRAASQSSARTRGHLDAPQNPQTRPTTPLSPATTFELFSQVTREAQELARRMRIAWNTKTGREPPRESLRFDELCGKLSLMLALQHRTGFSRRDIMKESIRVAASFPRDCFDILDEETEYREYHPRPFDASDIENSGRDPVIMLGGLVNLLGEMIHDKWSLSKVEKGWRFGVERKDAELMHPMLKSFQDLNAAEQRNDTETVCLILRITVALGYRIQPPQELKTDVVLEMPQYPTYRDQLAPGYVLRFIDTSSIKVDDSLRELGDVLAENVHDLWARNKKAEGFEYGAADAGQNGDAPRRHPLLKPYGMMGAGERKDDLDTVMETLRCVLALGYTIVFNKHRFIWTALLGH